MKFPTFSKSRRGPTHEAIPNLALQAFKAQADVITSRTEESLEAYRIGELTLPVDQNTEHRIERIQRYRQDLFRELDEELLLLHMEGRLRRQAILNELTASGLECGVLRESDIPAGMLDQSKKEGISNNE